MNMWYMNRVQSFRAKGIYSFIRPGMRTRRKKNPFRPSICLSRGIVCCCPHCGWLWFPYTGQGWIFFRAMFAPPRPAPSPCLSGISLRKIWPTGEYPQCYISWGNGGKEATRLNPPYPIFPLTQTGHVELWHNNVYLYTLSCSLVANQSWDDAKNFCKVKRGGRWSTISSFSKPIFPIKSRIRLSNWEYLFL